MFGCHIKGNAESQMWIFADFDSPLEEFDIA